MLTLKIKKIIIIIIKKKKKQTNKQTCTPCSVIEHFHICEGPFFGQCPDPS